MEPPIESHIRLKFLGSEVWTALVTAASLRGKRFKLAHQHLHHFFSLRECFRLWNPFIGQMAGEGPMFPRQSHVVQACSVPFMTCRSKVVERVPLRLFNGLQRARWRVLGSVASTPVDALGQVQCIKHRVVRSKQQDDSVDQAVSGNVVSGCHRSERVGSSLSDTDTHLFERWSALPSK